MRPLSALTCLATATMSMIACTSQPPDQPSRPRVQETTAMETQDRRPELAPLRAAIAQDLERSAASAASVAIWLDDEIIWVGGFGAIDPRQPGQAPDEQTQFMIGSDTKKIAALAYLQLVAQGKASLQTTLGQVLPELHLQGADAIGQASAHQLMIHQGGLNDDLGDLTTDTEDSALRDFVMTTLAERAYALSPPGAFFNYSNPNYSLLGLMTETIAARSWPELVQDQIFSPLQMTRTVARRAEVDATNYALGNPRQANAPLELAQLWEDAYLRPAGLVWSTPVDQIKLARFFVDGDERILPDELRRQMTSPHAEIFPELGEFYGYGLMIQDWLLHDEAFYSPVPVWSHGGNLLAHTSTFYILPEQRFAICILSNGGFDDFSQSVQVAIKTLVKLPPPQAPPEPPFDPEALDALTGEYVDPSQVLGRAVVSRQDQTLLISLPDVEAASIPYDEELFALSTRAWFLTIADTDLVISFVRGADGRDYLVHRAFVATKVSNPTALLRARPPLDATKLEALLRQPDPLTALMRQRAARP